MKKSPQVSIKKPMGIGPTMRLKLVCVFAADRFCDDKEPAPTEVAFIFDAGLQGQVIVAAIDFVEEIKGAEGGV